MQCPKCKTTRLRATKLETGLPAMGCPSCDGALISLLYYRDWAENAPFLDHKELSELASQPAEDSQTALSCPKCSRVMTKYKISGCVSNRLDYCASCDEAWLDGGEWELLKALELGTQIPGVLTEEWQRKLRDEAADKRWREKLAERIGEDAAQKADHFREWVKDHPHKPEILFFIGHE